MDGVEGVPTLDVSPYVRWRAQHAAYVEGEVLSDDAAKVVEGWGRAFGVYGFAQVLSAGALSRRLRRDASRELPAAATTPRPGGAVRVPARD